LLFKIMVHKRTLFCARIINMNKESICSFEKQYSTIMLEQ